MKSLLEEIEKRAMEMTREQREIRFRELRLKLNIASPELPTGRRRPECTSLEDHEEYQLLAELLGHKRASS
jgi:hypothetical protein